VSAALAALYAAVAPARPAPGPRHNYAQQAAQPGN
jgi:hypothetical protein